jgi:radical SAM superfamily enzyme YgiQ (UPF0313 family)
MKIVLLQTPWSDVTVGELTKMQKRYAFHPPIGLMYLAAFLEKNGHSADIIDLEAEPLDFKKLLDRIVQAKADMIGITSTSPLFHIAQTYAKVLRESLRLPIVVGGPHVTALKDKTLTEEFDFAIMNEGEYALAELMDEIGRERNYSKIDGLIYRQGDQAKVNPQRVFIENLDSLPFPARHKLDPYKYRFEVPGKGFIPVADVELTRGCPFHCVFCSDPLNTGRKLRSRSAKNIVDEIMEVKEKCGIGHFFMLDSTLTLNQKLIEDFCYELIKRKADITFEGQTRVNLINEPLLDLMKKAGLLRLSFGLESADKKVLTLMCKEIDLESARKTFYLCKKLNISIFCGTMMGNPGDTRETILATAWFVRSIPEIRYAPMAIAIPYPGTELFNMAQAGMHGLKLIESDYKKYGRYSGGVMEVDGMKPAELVKLQRRALFIMHSTPSKIIGLIQHFGLLNLIHIVLKIIQNEIIALFTGSDPSLTRIEDGNTTLLNLGLIPGKAKAKKRN